MSCVLRPEPQGTVDRSYVGIRWVAAGPRVAAVSSQG